MRTTLFISAAVSVGLSAVLSSQTTPPPPVAPAPSTSQPAADLGNIRLRALQGVLDARERRMNWHDAAEQAEAPVQGDALKAQLTQRLSGLAPRVAKMLVGHPESEALVDVDVYKEAAGEGKQALVAVTFEGLETDIGQDYFAGLLTDVVKPPEAEGIPQGLVYDPAASSHLVFFMGKTGLEAGDIPQAKMKQSILAAMNHQRELTAQQDQHAFEQQQLQQQNLQQQAAAQQQQLDQAQQAAASGQQVIPEYPNDNYNNYDDGYYYPGLGVPIVILPNGYTNTPEWRNRERAREEALEKRYARQAPQATPNNTSERLPRPAGVEIPPGQAGVTNPPGRAGVEIPPGSAGIRSGAGQGNVQRQAPAPPPAGRQAPQAPQAPAAHEAPSAPPAPAHK
jgi:hypothetical protein